MSTSLVFKLPFPPSVNTYWRNYRGRTVLNARGRQYKKDVYQILLPERTLLETPLTGRLRVVYGLYPPDKRKRDVDNYAKGLLDAIGEAGIYEDDSQVVTMTGLKLDKVKDGHVMVLVKEVDDQIDFFGYISNL